MSTPTYRRILVGIDFSPLGELALGAAVHLAQRMEVERIHLVHAMPQSPSWALAIDNGLALAWNYAFKDAQKKLDELEVPKSRARVTRQAVVGGAAHELIRAAGEMGADLIVVATHGRSGVGRIMLGSIAGAIIRQAPCPVLVVGEGRAGLAPIHRVLAAVDLSPVSERVLAHAVAFAQPERGLVHALSLYEIPELIGDDDVLARFLTPAEAARFPEQHRARVRDLAASVRVPEVEIVADVMSRSPPSRVILDVAARVKSDLITVGTSGHNAIERIYLGATATHVLAEAKVPVLVVPRPVMRA